MQQAPHLVNPFHRQPDLLLDNFNLLTDRKVGKQLPRRKIMLDLPEYPRTTDGSPANHDGIHPVFVKCLGSPFRGSDIPVPDNGNRDAGIALDPGNRLPVRLTRVHLCPRAPVDCQSPDAHILQTLGNILYDDMLAVPAQARLGSDRQLHGIHHLPRHLDHQGDIPEQPGARSLLGYPLDRATEIQVNEIRLHLFHNPRRLNHRIHKAAVYLDGNRAFTIINGQLLQGFINGTHQRVRRNKLRIKPICPECLAKLPERRIGHIFHGS